MGANILLPHTFRQLGWIILVPAAILGMLVLFDNFSLDILDSRMITIYNSDSVPLIRPKTQGHWFQIIDVNFTQTIIGLLNIFALLFIAFSKEKEEDEFIRKVRLDALVMATYVNYGFLIICFVFFYNLDFLMVMIFNMFTTVIFFIIFFRYMIYKSQKTVVNEE